MPDLGINQLLPPLSQSAPSGISAPNPGKTAWKTRIFPPRKPGIPGEMPEIPWKFLKIVFSYLVGGKTPGKSLGNVQIPQEKKKKTFGSDLDFLGKLPCVKIQRLQVFLGIWAPDRATFGVFVCLALRNFNKAFDTNPASGILSGKTRKGSPG